jgi:hypothetical protein
MKAVRHLLALVAMALAATTASAQFVKGNEAVKVMPDGPRRWRRLRCHGRTSWQSPAQPTQGCHGGGWMMVETQDGLRRVHRAYARPGTCRKSTYGTEKLSRLWIVKPGGSGCSASPRLGGKCVSIEGLPPAPFGSSSRSQCHVHLGRFAVRRHSQHLRARRGVDADDCDRPDRPDCDDDLGALYGWAVLRNEVSETLPTFMWKVFKIGLVLAFALQSGFYISNVSDTANGLAMGVATTFLPSAVDPMTVTSPYACWTFNDEASQQVCDLLKEASIIRLDLVFAAVVFSIGNVVFLCIALFVVTLAKLFLTS